MNPVLLDDIERFAADDITDDLIRASQIAEAYKNPSVGASSFCIGVDVIGNPLLKRVIIKSHSRTSALVWILAIDPEDRLSHSLPGKADLGGPPSWPKETTLSTTALSEALYPVMEGIGEGREVANTIEDPLTGITYQLNSVLIRKRILAKKSWGLSIRPLGSEAALPLVFSNWDSWHLFTFLPSSDIDKWQKTTVLRDRFIHSR
jgi:hypothetical protein